MGGGAVELNWAAPPGAVGGVLHGGGRASWAASACC